MTDLIDSTDPDTLVEAHASNKSALSSVADNVKQIHEKMPKTFSFTQNFNSSWKQIEDCRAFRKILLHFEVEGCYQFSWYTYISTIVSAINLFLLFVFSWILFFVVRSSGNMVDQVVAPPRTAEE